MKQAGNDIWTLQPIAIVVRSDRRNANWCAHCLATYHESVFYSCERKKWPFRSDLKCDFFQRRNQVKHVMTYPLKTWRFHAHHINVGRTYQEDDDMRTTHGAQRESKLIGKQSRHGHVKSVSIGKVEHWYLASAAMTKLDWQFTSSEIISTSIVRIPSMPLPVEECHDLITHEFSNTWIHHSRGTAPSLPSM